MTRSVFWTALAIAFLALAVVAWRERRRIHEREHPFGGMPSYLIPSPVAEALRSILLAELVGFVLAAAAALYEAFT